jgi:hypothetical protein
LARLLSPTGVSAALPSPARRVRADYLIIRVPSVCLAGATFDRASPSFDGIDRLEQNFVSLSQMPAITHRRSCSFTNPAHLLPSVLPTLATISYQLSLSPRDTSSPRCPRKKRRSGTRAGQGLAEMRLPAIQSNPEKRVSSSHSWGFNHLAASFKGHTIAVRPHFERVQQ